MALCNLLSFVNLDLFGFVPTNCMIRKRHDLFYDRLLAFTLIPIAVVVAILVLMYRRRRLALDAETRANAFVFYMSVTLAFTFVIFVSVSQTVSSAISPCPCGTDFLTLCQVLEFFGNTILENGDCYITGHFSTACDTPRYRSFVPYACLCILICT